MNKHVPETVADRPKPRLDRLSAIIAALRPVATVCAADDPSAQFVLTPTRLVLRLRSGLPPEPDATAAARLDCALPLAQTLCRASDRLEITLDECPDLAALASVLSSEAEARRCGAPHAMARLVEAMLVIALRRAVDAAPPARGLLAGLSHSRLHRALVAIHDRPGAPWTVEALAAEAGMSRSRFMAGFTEAIGVSPMAYVTQWRLELARDALARGVSMKEVAHRLGYRSIAGFRRAWQRQSGGPSHGS